jgi:hypothetical protein
MIGYAMGHVKAQCRISMLQRGSVFHFLSGPQPPERVARARAAPKIRDTLYHSELARN